MRKLQYNIKKDAYKFSEETVSFFINIGLQITRRCNFKCIHCCESEQIPDAKLETIKDIVNRLATAGLKRVCVTGGEPLLREELVEILKYIHNRNLGITLVTNGSLLDKNKLMEVKPYIQNIRFSLHGVEETHDRITGYKGSFRKVIDNINIATKMDIPVSIVMSVFSQNYPEMLDIAKICEENGIEKLYFFSLMPRGRGRDLCNINNIPFDEIKTTFNKIVTISNEESWNLVITIIDWRKEGQCALVFPNGDLVGVPSFKDKDNTKIVGNILKEAPHLLWENYPFKKNYINYYKNH